MNLIKCSFGKIELILILSATLGFTAVSFASTSTASEIRSADLGFRWTNGSCRNGQGLEGLNPHFLGECGDHSDEDLSGKVLKDLSLRGSVFIRASLTDLQLKNVDLSDSRFESVIFSGGTFENVNAQRIKMLNSSGSYSSFIKTNFTGSLWQGGPMFGYNSYEGCDFRGADVRTGGFGRQPMSANLISETTLLPANVDRQKLIDQGMVVLKAD